jgi:Response regulator receiver domain
MDPEVQVALIQLLPAALWVAFWVVLVWIFYRPIRDEVIPRLSSFKVMGVEVGLRNLDEAAKAKGMTLSTEARTRVGRRAQRAADIVQGAQILWVDDHPSGNRDLVRTLTSFGMVVDVARSSNEAFDMLDRRIYDVIISDIKRDNEPEDGKAFVKKIPDVGIKTLAIFYIGSPFDPKLGVPKGVLGGTNRPDELLHLVIDALERERS